MQAGAWLRMADSGWEGACGDGGKVERSEEGAEGDGLGRWASTVVWRVVGAVCGGCVAEGSHNGGTMLVEGLVAGSPWMGRVWLMGCPWRGGGGALQVPPPVHGPCGMGGSK